ncbi:ATP-dependent Clp protease proteolytic subunit [Pseudomonas sp. NPDC007930]|uniref:ATP-dependent Clp protease proteolytic subunit n=1 Tax=Pseudomonas sp. NPDC007930 TaxID=3364417 RepID=UPI0036E5500A
MTLHIVNFTGPIHSATCGRLIEVCSSAVRAEASSILLKIATMGGEASYGFTLFNFLRSLPVPVNTHNLGTVESMGNILYLAGSHRTACRHSKFLFHPFHWNLNGSVDHARMAEYAMSMDFDLELYARITLERTAGAPKAMAIRDYLLAAPAIISAEEAIDYGLVHAVDEATDYAGAVSHAVHN